VVEEALAAVVNRRAAELATELRQGEPVNVALASYNPSEAPVVPLAFRFIGSPWSRPVEGSLQEADDVGPNPSWERTFGAGLERLRRALAASPRTRRIRFYPRCTLATSARAGAVFHRATGLGVECDQDGILWNLSGERDRAAEVRTLVQHADPSPEEFHVLVSATGESRPLYQQWRERSFRATAQVVEIRPEADPSRTLIRNAAHALGWADHVFLAIAQLRHDPTILIRLFLYCPAGLAVAVGQSLNAMGDIALMDMDKGQRRYVESFRFRA
jgi:hypothetical protein